MERTPPLSTSAARIRGAVFSELQRHIDAYAKTGGTLVPLHIGDTWLAPPPAARYDRANAAHGDDVLYRYGATSGLAALRAAIAARVTRLARASAGDAASATALTIDPDANVLLGVGGTHALFCAARAALDPGDEVLVGAPYWPLAPGVFHAAGALPVEVPFTSRLYEDPGADPAALLGAALTSRTKAVYVISPNNPDGKVLTRAQLARLADFAAAHDLWVFSDEVYADFAYDVPHVPFASLPGMAARTITLHSLSKSHALAGARIGAAIGPDSLIAAARRVSTHSAFNVPVAMQHAALAALETGDPWIDEARRTYRAARDAAARALAIVGAGVRFPLAEGGTYLFVDFAGVLRGRPLARLLELAIARGVLLAPGDACARDAATSARLCFTSVPPPLLDDGIARLRAAIDAFARG